MPLAAVMPVITDVNHLLEALLLKELPLKKNHIEISFHQPTRDRFSRLNGPTLNVFLYDIRKNKLRQGQWETRANGIDRATLQRPPLRIDLHYLLTAWVSDGDPEEEHYLLTAALLALARHPRLPDPEPNGKDTLPDGSRIDLEFLPEGLRRQPGPISLLVAEPDDLLNLTDIWSALDNALRPALACTVTIALDPFQPIERVVVRQRELRFGPVADAAAKPPLELLTIDQWPPPKRDVYQVEGGVGGDEPLGAIQVFLVGRGASGLNLEVPITVNAGKTEYTFILDQLPVGTYQLEILAANHRPVRFDLVISPEETETLTQKKGKIWLFTSIKKQGEKL
ncbi:MAG: DUF4255 domain-containing protein [Anaerolineae bacterium]|nr:DUF4255 domain-containing protein [Anaerolineae bacterium]